MYSFSEYTNLQQQVESLTIKLRKSEAKCRYLENKVDILEGVYLKNRKKALKMISEGVKPLTKIANECNLSYHTVIGIRNKHNERTQ